MAGAVTPRSVETWSRAGERRFGSFWSCSARLCIEMAIPPSLRLRAEQVNPGPISSWRGTFVPSGLCA